MTKKNKILVIGGSILAVLGLSSLAAKANNLLNFINLMSFTPSVKSISVAGADIFNFPPVLGSAKVNLDLRIDNPLTQTHTISELSIRIFDTTANKSAQIGNSVPTGLKYTVAAGTSTIIKDVQLLIPIQNLTSVFNISLLKSIIQSGIFRLGRTFQITVDLKLDGYSGSRISTITI